MAIVPFQSGLKIKLPGFRATDHLRFSLLPGVNPKSICGKVPQNVSHMDGLRLSFEDDTWLLVRPSGTEPVVRVYAEGFSVEERDELLDAGCALARGTYPL